MIPKTFTERLTAAIHHLETELASLRTGRANPALIEDLSVECYGSRTPLMQLAAISAPEPQLLVVQPWDPSIVKDIERALSTSSLGIMPVVDGKIIRLPFPAMTEERRKELGRVAKEKAEQAKISARGAREEAMKELKAQAAAGTISEDVQDLEQKQVQEQIEATNKTIEERLETKLSELATF